MAVTGSAFTGSTVTGSTFNGGAPADRPSAARAGLAAALHLLLPRPCCGCGATLARPTDFGLCLRCRGRLAAHRPGCPRCGQPLPHGRRRAEPCAPCRRRPPAYRRAVSPWLFVPPLVEVVHALKFARCAHLGAALARPLADWLGEHRALRLDTARPAVDLVVAVPLHPLRRLRRGYNQAALVAQPLAAALGLPVARPLVRRRATRSQSRLPREHRHANVAGAFRVRRRQAAAVAARRVLLVDDVATTGATLDAAARALRDAGAAAVVAVTVARTPPPGLD